MPIEYKSLKVGLQCCGVLMLVFKPHDAHAQVRDACRQQFLSSHAHKKPTGLTRGANSMANRLLARELKDMPSASSPEVF